MITKTRNRQTFELLCNKKYFTQTEFLSSLESISAIWVNLLNKTNREYHYLRIFSFLARLILGGIFIYACIDKIAFPADFANSIESYNILPIFLIKPTALILPWVELIFGIFLIVGLFIKESALILTSLMGVFLIVLGIQATKGPIEDCGCFGNIAFLSSSNTSFLIFRDLIFLSIGLEIIFIERRKNNVKKEIA